MTRSWQRWTAQEDGVIRLANASGKHDSEIVVEGRTRRAIAKRRRDLGLKYRLGSALATNRPWDDEQDRRLRQMFGRGLKDDEIAAQLRRTAPGVLLRRGKLGLLRTSGWRNRNDRAAKLKALIDDIDDMLKGKLPHQEIREFVRRTR